MTSPLTFQPTPLLDEHFDHEVAQLELGLRHVIKREFCPEETLGQMHARGWSVARIEGGYHLGPDSADVQHGGGGHHTVFIGSPESVDAACHWEAIERTAQGQTRQEAMVELGRLLGYPTCCTDAYLSQDEQGESASFARLSSILAFFAGCMRHQPSKILGIRL